MTTPDIYLLGSGIRGTLQFTRETIQAIKASRVCYVLHDDTMIHDFVRDFGCQVVDLAELYDGAEVRRDVYERISKILVEAAQADEEGPVSFLVHGHPLFLVSATEYTLELAKEAGLNVEMVPGVSSFDTLLCDVGEDWGYALQMYDTTTLLHEGWSVNPAVPLLLFQLSTTLNPNVVRGEPDQSVLRPIVDLLLKFYPPEHRCTLIHSSSHLLERAERTELQLKDLEQEAASRLWQRPTLYVPAVESEAKR